jgi:hypothetical protein
LTLLTLRQVDGTLTTALLREDDLHHLWEGAALFDAVLPRACDLRLLRVTTRRLDAGHEERLVSLGHDALAKVAEPWRQELERQAERRKWLTLAATVLAVLLVFAFLSLDLYATNKRVRVAGMKAVEANARLVTTIQRLDAARAEAGEKRRLADLQLYESDMARA